MMRAGTSAIVLGLFVLGLASLVVMAVPERAQAQSAAPHIKTADHGLTAEEFSAQSRRVIRRAPRRVPIYRGSNYPGPNSRRVCSAHYEQEYRPSGTVIVPRMNCYWSG
ncbi:MAG TPA: hypothetical protein VF467_07980 [Afipia sp.]